MSLKKLVAALALTAGASLAVPDLFVSTAAAAPPAELAKLDTAAALHAKKGKGKHHKHRKHHKHPKGGKKK
jgi:hypothetical protein